jgi:hypothetical protein
MRSSGRRNPRQAFLSCCGTVAALTKRLDPSWIVMDSIENPQHDRCVDACSRARTGASDLRSSAATQRTLGRGRLSATIPDCAMPRKAKPWSRRRGGSRG